MKKYFKLKITDFILIVVELILCGILIDQIWFNNFPVFSGLLLIFFIVGSVGLIIYLASRDNNQL